MHTANEDGTATANKEGTTASNDSDATTDDADDPTFHVGHTTIQIPVHRGAETFSFFSHALGVLVAVVALVWLVVRATGPLAVTTYAIYGTTLIALFSASTAHHAIQTATGTERSGLMRRLDHVSIYLFIAGTYTPITLLALSPGWGWAIFGVVWGVALAGIILKLFAPFTPRWATSGIYIAMGWIALVGIKPLLDAFPPDALGLLLGGGVVYTVGAVGYAMKKPDLWPKVIGFHGVWHVMVLVGAGMHLAFIVLHVPSS